MNFQPTLVPVDDKQTGLDKILRRKSAMVLYQLEQTLGDFVCNEKKDASELPSGTLADITERERKSGRSIDSSTTRGIIAATYIDEVLSLAQNAAKGRQEEEHLKRLRELFKVLEIQDIRNTISHPNRPFHPCYWHRVAAIATDPLIDKLLFREVTQAFLDAEAGRLSSPPEEWINAPIWSLPNNLPQRFDHEITGLIGRKNQLSELKKALKKKNINLIAIIAPGGLGKTALLLQALYDIVHSPDSADWVEQVLYITSKTEVLTHEGIVKQNPVATDMESIRDSIALTLAEQEGLDNLTFEDACHEFGHKRIILCLDNLETILRDNPSAFNSFFLDLPDEWKIVVTSRIAVNGAYAISLQPLDSIGAKALAQSYLSKRGGERLSENELNNLVHECQSNPLAIRLIIDGFIAGKTLSESIPKAKEQLLEFSYKNLIEALSPLAYEVLECLFVTREPISRSKACILLERNIDEVAQAFSQLQGTSLVTRISELAEESYKLSSSIYELLLLNPVDISVRLAVQEKVQKTTQKIVELKNRQDEHQTNPLFWKYIPESAPDEVKEIALDVFQVLSRPSFDWGRLADSDRHRVSELRSTLKRAIDAYKDQSFLYRLLGILLLKLHDRTGGQSALRQALEMEPPDVASGLLLSNELRKGKDLKGARDVAKRLVDLGWNDLERSDAYHASLVIKNYWLPLIWLGETDQVIQETKHWQKAGNLCGTYGLLRAQALRQSAEYGSFRNLPKGLCEAVDVLSELFKLEGYAGSYVDEGMKLVKQLAFTTGRDDGTNEEAKLKFTEFIDQHLVQMCQVHNTYTLDHPVVQQWVKELSILSIENNHNPLISVRWQELIEAPREEESELYADSERGWLRVSVYYRPTPTSKGHKGHKPFLFAQDNNKQQYFVHRDKLNSSARREWANIQIGDYLEVLPDPQGEEGTAQPVREARLVRR